MKKHSFAMVFLLILLLSLIGAVSADEDLSAVDVEAPVCQSNDYAQIEVSDEYLSDSADEAVSISDCEIKTVDAGGQTSESYKNSISYSQGRYLDEGIDNNVGEAISISSEMLSFSDNQDDLSVSSFDELIDGFNYHYLDLNSQSADLSWDDNELRHNISNVLGSLLDLNSASEILAVTVDLSKIDKLAIENVLSQIVSSSHGYVNNGYDNLFGLSSIKTGLINIAFIKNDDFLAVALYDTQNTLLYYNDCQEISAGLWDAISSWTNGILRHDAALGSYCISDKGEVEKSQLTHPPTEFDLPLGYTWDYLGDSRDSDADAFIWSVDNTSGKRACIGVALVDESIDGLLSSSLSDVALQSPNTVEVLKSSTGDLKQIGVDATNRALAYFESIGIDIKKGYPKFYVLTSAGYVKIRGTGTKSVLDGISEVLGSDKNILPIHTPLWKDLVFYYLWVNNANNKDKASYALKYDENTGILVVSNTVRSQGDDIAYKMGLYDKYHKYHPHHHNHGYKRIASPIGESFPVIEQNNTEANVTSTAKENKTVNDTVLVEISKQVIEDIPTVENNPYNILVVIFSIAVICIFFRLSYTKKD